MIFVCCWRSCVRFILLQAQKVNPVQESVGDHSPSWDRKWRVDSRAEGLGSLDLRCDCGFENKDRLLRYGLSILIALRSGSRLTHEGIRLRRLPPRPANALDEVGSLCEYKQRTGAICRFYSRFPWQTHSQAQVALFRKILVR